MPVDKLTTLIISLILCVSHVAAKFSNKNVFCLLIDLFLNFWRRCVNRTKLYPQLE